MLHPECSVWSGSTLFVTQPVMLTNIWSTIDIVLREAGTIPGETTVIVVLASLLKNGLLLKERICEQILSF